MLKNFFKNQRSNFLAIIFMSSFLWTGAWAHQDHHSHGKSDKNHADHDAEGKDITLSGHMIGMTCFVKHGAKGEGHRSCARECAEKGLPIGLKTKEGIYLITGPGHDSLIETYKPLLKYLEKEVTIQGKAFEREGSRMLTVQRIREKS